MGLHRDICDSYYSHRVSELDDYVVSRSIETLSRLIKLKHLIMDNEDLDRETESKLIELINRIRESILIDLFAKNA